MAFRWRGSRSANGRRPRVERERDGVFDHEHEPGVVQRGSGLGQVAGDEPLPELLPPPGEFGFVFFGHLLFSYDRGDDHRGDLSRFHGFTSSVMLKARR
jgi:hypothetical protein